MKIIELFDEAPLENIIGTLAFKPSETVYFGTIKHDRFEKHYLSKIKELLALKKLGHIKVSYVQVWKNNLFDCVRKLNQHITDDCMIDIVGGEDTLLTAVGMVFEKSSTLKLFRMNPHSGKAYIIDKTNIEKGGYPKQFEVSVNVHENAVLHGGDLANTDNKFTYSNEFCDDIKTLWKLCSKGPQGYMHKRSAPQTWNGFIQTAAGIENMGKGRQLEALKKYKVRTYLEELQRLGFVSYKTRADGSLYDFSYKNAQIRSCLTKAGDALEQIIYLTLCKYLGHGLSDVKVGVTLKWKADGEQGRHITENEIDVFVMRGATPVLISCKNGKFSSDELYKLSTVADKFGEKYAKKILIVSDLKGNETAQTVRHLRSRAEEMNIRIIENVHKMSLDELDKTLKNAVLG